VTDILAGSTGKEGTQVVTYSHIDRAVLCHVGIQIGRVKLFFYEVRQVRFYHIRICTLQTAVCFYHLASPWFTFFGVTLVSCNAAGIPLSSDIYLKPVTRAVVSPSRALGIICFIYIGRMKECLFFNIHFQHIHVYMDDFNICNCFKSYYKVTK
jgi:hypothetical protein